MNTFFRFSLVILCLFIAQIQALIVETPKLEVFKTAAELADTDTLVMFDIDDTILYNTDLILRACNRSISEKFLAGIIKNPEIIPHGKYPEDYLKSQILLNIDIELVDQDVAALIKNLQSRQIKTIAFTKYSYGNLGVIPSLAHWRIDQLLKFGIDFGNPFPNFHHKEIVTDTVQALFIKGILFANRQNKGPVLVAFLNEIKWKPKKIIFLDDRMDYLQTVEDSLKNSGIEFIGYHYTEIEDHPIACNEEMAHAQYMHLAIHGVWLSDKVYKKMHSELAVESTKITN